ncbi:MAG: hypothetical protein H7839_10815 [Magnetococcus sp. YQC-5]
MDKTPCLIDTNVPLTANGNNHLSLSCQLECSITLAEIMSNGVLVLDSQWKIIKEYQNKLYPAKPGMGNNFLKWVLTHRTNPKKISYVTITPRLNTQDDTEFAEFPEHSGLKSFDRADRKLVAAANAHIPKAPIYQAADSKWLGWRAALRECGIEVKFLCKEELAILHQKKTGSPLLPG